MTPYRSGQPVRVTLNSVSRQGKIVCANADGAVRVRVAGVSQDVEAACVEPVRLATSDRWAELHGVRS